jgi:glycosidase
LIALRRATPALNAGTFELVREPTRQVAVYTRRSGDELVLVALNFSDTAQAVSIPHAVQSRSWKLLLSNRRSLPPDLLSGQLNLKPDEALILQG